MLLAELLAHIGLEFDEEPLEKLKEGFEHVKESFEGLNEKLEGVKERLNLIIGVEAVAKLYEMSERFAQWGSQLNITAQNIGVTTEALQGLVFAAGDFGVSQEMMSESLAHLSRSLYAAKNGSVEMQTHFAKAGFDSAALERFKTSEEALLAIADKLQAIDEPMRRMAVAQELLGRGGFRMVAFLKQGSGAIKEQREELKKLGLELSGPQVQALVQVDSTFHKLHAILAAIGSQIASYVGPAFTFLVDKFIGLYAANKNLIDAGTTTWLDTLLYGLGFVSGVVYSLIGRFGHLGKAIADAFKKEGIGGVFDLLLQRVKSIFSEENLRGLGESLQKIMASNAFSEAVRIALNTGLILSGFALNFGFEIVKGIILGLAPAVVKALFANGAEGLKNLAKIAFKIVNPGALGAEAGAEEGAAKTEEEKESTRKWVAGILSLGMALANPGTAAASGLATSASAALGTTINRTANSSVGGSTTVHAQTTVNVNAPAGVAATADQIGKHVEAATEKAIGRMLRQADNDIPNPSK